MKKIDNTVEKCVQCNCGRTISFGPLGEKIITGIKEEDYDEYLRLATVLNWPQFVDAVVNLKPAFKRLRGLEESFYHCECGRLLWNKAGTKNVIIFSQE